MSTTALNGINPNQRMQLNFNEVLGEILNPEKEDSSENTSIPGACEERPVMVDPETGERVYVDVYRQEHMPPYICYEA